MTSLAWRFRQALLVFPGKRGLISTHFLPEVLEVKRSSSSVVDQAAVGGVVGGAEWRARMYGFDGKCLGEAFFGLDFGIGGRVVLELGGRFWPLWGGLWFIWGVVGWKGLSGDAIDSGVLLGWEGAWRRRDSLVGSSKPRVNAGAAVDR